MERAVRIKPSLTEGYYHLGKIYEKTDRRKSLSYYAKFRSLAKEDPEFLGQLSTVTDILKKNSKKKRR